MHSQVTTKLQQKENHQESFNAAWDHFVVKGRRPSIDRHGGCVYNGRSGAKCAFAVLLTQDELGRVREGNLASMVIEELNLSRFLNPYGAPDHFYDSLQDCHDANARSAGFQKAIRKDLEDLANRYGLEVPNEGTT